MREDARFSADSAYRCPSVAVIGSEHAYRNRAFPLRNPHSHVVHYRT